MRRDLLIICCLLAECFDAFVVLKSLSGLSSAALKSLDSDLFKWLVWWWSAEPL